MQRDQRSSISGSAGALQKIENAWKEKVRIALAQLLYRAPDCHDSCLRLIKGKAGIEIGGPSQIFTRTGQCPLYEDIDALDNCNFSEDSLWGKNNPHNDEFIYSSNKSAGHQKILEATSLQEIASCSYDFLISSHTIEHTANPLLALEEWKRIVKPSGILILVIPHKDGTFDHFRPVTSITHLIEDWHASTGEDDLTHLKEIMKYHDFSRDKGAKNKESFYERALKNLKNRGLHHHVFDTKLVIEMLCYAGLQILNIEPVRKCHIFAVAKKPGMAQSADNCDFLAAMHQILANSPFPSDRN